MEPGGSLLCLQEPPVVAVLSNIISVYTVQPYVYETFFSHLLLDLPSGLFHSGFPTNNLHSLVSSPIRATCPAHLILLDLTILITLGEEYKLWSSSLCSFLQPPVSSSLYYISQSIEHALLQCNKPWLQKRFLLSLLTSDVLQNTRILTKLFTLM
jgi:hypothetical protein